MELLTSNLFGCFFVMLFRLAWATEAQPPAHPYCVQNDVQFNEKEGECERPPPVIPHKYNTDSYTLWDLIEKTEKDLVSHEGDAVIFVGNSGSGKTTLALAISGDIKDLTVYETAGQSLIIVDPNQKIAASTSSRTLVPDLIVDTKNDLFLYDFPGFRDTRGHKADITARHLMNEVTKNLSSVRIVITVAEDMVNADVTSSDFSTLAMELINLIPDLDKMGPAIGMVVTKVKKLNAMGNVRDTKTVLNGIQDFLNLYKESQKEKLASMQSESMRLFNDETETLDIILRKIKLTDILLQEGKISLFRLPNKCGSLDKSNWAQINTNGVIALIKEVLKPVSTSPNDFRCVVCPETIVHLERLNNQLNLNVSNVMTQLVHNISGSHLETRSFMKTFFGSKAFVEEEYGNFSDLVALFNTIQSPTELGLSVQSTTTSRGYDKIWGARFHSDMKIIEARMKFLDSFTPDGMTLERKTDQWLEPLKHWVLDTLQKSYLWFQFLDKLRDLLATVEFQTSKPSSIPENITALKEALGIKGHIVTQNIQVLYAEETFSEERNILWEIVNEALEKPHVECTPTDPTEVTITGSFMRAKEFLNHYDITHPFLKCKNITVSRWVVFARRKFIMDGHVAGSLNESFQSEIAIVTPELEMALTYTYVDIYGLDGNDANNGSDGANGTFPNKTRSNENNFDNDTSNSVRPKWEVIEDQVKVKRSVNASLTSASDYEELNGVKVLRMVREYCLDGKNPSDGQPGGDGLPGLPGFPGGSFILLAPKIHGGKLNVYIQGGKGGHAGSGGNGGHGANGHPYDENSMIGLKYVGCEKGPCPGDCAADGSECPRSYSWIQGQFDSCRFTDNLLGLHFYNCYASGCPGSKGGKGGAPGSQGFHGPAGQALIYSRSVHPTIKNVSEIRKAQPGKGGRGGQMGAGIARTAFSFDEKGGTWIHINNTLPLSIYSAWGANGDLTENAIGKLNPKSRQPYKLTPAGVYMQYLKYVLSKNSVHFPQDDFYHFIETSPEFAAATTPLELGQQLLSLEESHLLLKIQQVERESIALAMIPLYKSFLTRLDTYTNTSSNLPDTSRKFLSLIYSLALNQLRILKQITGTPVIVDVAEYLQAVQKRLNQYEIIKDHSDRVKLVEEERQRYKDIFVGRIEETGQIISTTVDPLVNKTHESINEVTKKLEVAIEIMISESLKQEENYRAAKETAEKQLKATQLATPMQNAAAYLQLLAGPGVKALAESLETVDLNGGGLSLGDGKEIRPPKPLPDSIKKYADMVDADFTRICKRRAEQVNILLEESETAKKILGDVLEEVGNETSIQTFPFLNWIKKAGKFLLDEVVVPFVDKALEIREKLVEGIMKSLPSQLLDIIENFLGMKSEGLVCSVEEFLKSLKADSSPHGSTLASAFSKLLNMMNVNEISALAAKKVQHDEENLRKVSEMFDEAAKQTVDLQNYKNSVKKLVGPFTESIVEDMNDAKKRMENGSAVALRVQKWEVKKTLRELNTFLTDISEAFPDISKEYTELVVDLREAMDLLIDLYSFIQQYMDQILFADFIANLNTPRAIGTSMGKELDETFEKINLALLGSMILSEWDTLFQNFEQWVFPFSKDFQTLYANKKIPDYLAKNVTNTSVLLQEIIPNIRLWVNDLEIEFQKYKSSVVPSIDENLIIANFNSEFESLTPFHVWDNELHRDKIKQFLSGQSVTFSISPDHTYKYDMSAVKFTVAEIQPKAKDERDQFELQQSLKKLRVEMTHSGISRYLYDDSAFQMVGSKLTIQFNYERDTNGERLNRNNVYLKMQQGDVILSPYSIWTVKLVTANPQIEFDWEEFANSFRLVDLELVGKGTFVRKNSKLQLKSDYLPVNPNHTRVYTPQLYKLPKKSQPLHYYRFRMANLPPISDNSVLSKVLSGI